MATIAKWGNHKFVVSRKVVQSFRDLNITGSCETEEKTANGQKYVNRKNGKPYEITFTVDLNALTGMKDVRGEAEKYLQEAEKGETHYLYLGGAKLLKTNLKLVTAKVSDIAFMPRKGDKWIACSVKLTMKKGAVQDGSGSGSGGSGGYTARVYYSTGSGAVRSVTGWSSVSYADALKKAYAKVPGNATWSSTRPGTPGQANGVQPTQPTAPATSQASLNATRLQASQTSQAAGNTPTTSRYGLENRQNNQQNP